MFRCLLVILTVAAYPLTEDQIVQHALRNSHQIRKYLVAIKSAEQEQQKAKKEASIGVRPTLDVSTTGHLNDTAGLYDSVDGLHAAPGVEVTAPMPGGGEIALSAASDNLEDHTLSATVNQPLLQGGLKGSVLDHNKKTAIIQYQISQKENLYKVLSHVADIRTAFWQTYLSQEIVKIMEYADQIARITHRHSLARFRVGDASTLDTLESLWTLNSFIAELLKAKITYTKGERTLMEKANIKTMDTLTPGALTYPDQVEISAMVDKAVNANLSFLQTEDLLRLFQADEEYYSNWRLPRLDLYGGYQASGRDDFPEQGSYTVGLRFSYDLFNNTSTNDYQIAKRTKQFQDYTVKEKRQALELTIERVGDEFSLQHHKVTTLKANLAIAERKYRIATELYKNGNVDIVSKMKAQNDLIQAKVDLLEAEVEIMSLLIRLDLYTNDMLVKYNVKSE